MKDKALEIAKQEIQVMQALSRRPRTRVELEHDLQIPARRMAYLINGLREVEYVYRVPGTHILAMTS